MENDELTQLLLMAAVEKAVKASMNSLESLMETVNGLGYLRKLLIGTTRAAEMLESDTSLLCDPAKIGQAENLCWDALEKVMEALEPPPEDIDRLADGDDELKNKLLNFIMNQKHALAERRAEATR